MMGAGAHGGTREWEESTQRGVMGLRRNRNGGAIRSVLVGEGSRRGNGASHSNHFVITHVHAPGPVRSEDRPDFRPRRDVDLEYVAADGSLSIKMTATVFQLS